MSAEPKLVHRKRLHAGEVVPGRVYVEHGDAQFYVDCTRCGNADTRSDPCEHEKALWQALDKRPR
jgi:hypothetical protein